MDEALKISIQSYLESIGIPTKKQGNKIFASSPFSNDSNWSFCIYPDTNSYFDYSTGHGGNIINLVSRINICSFKDAINILNKGAYEKYKPNNKYYQEESKFWEDFQISKYINTNKEECKKIEDYAKSRGITEGYVKAVYFTREGDRWVRNPSVGFIHVNKYYQPCGIKFRKITNENPRFSARGNLGFYVLDSHSDVEFLPKVLYVVESESSAYSLWSYLKKIKRPAIVISRGGVSSAPRLEELPEKLRYLQKKIIIDYDGNEKLYQERLKLYSDLKAEPIKLILPKGEDLNSLYVKGKIDLIENLI